MNGKTVPHQLGGKGAKAMAERNTAQNGTMPSIEEIAREAYAIYAARGFQNGKDVEDWLEAERRLTATDVKSGSRSPRRRVTA
jgi:hypothetical protein